MPFCSFRSVATFVGAFLLAWLTIPLVLQSPQSGSVLMPPTVPLLYS